MQNSTPNLRDYSKSVRIKNIFQKDNRTLHIDWTDHSSNDFDVVSLRRSCPCAYCIDEWTHEQLLKPTDVSEDIRPLKVESVGQYALTIHFSDGHKTGIYTFNLLKKLALH